MDSETARVAQTFADHALLLLATGIMLVGLALAAVVAVARLAGRYRTHQFDGALWISRRIHRVPLLGPAVARARVVVPTSYVALHLVLGLVATAAATAFVVIAEEVVAGRAVAAFDVAFADALQDSASPRWQEVFSASPGLVRHKFSWPCPWCPPSYCCFDGTTCSRSGG